MSDYVAGRPLTAAQLNEGGPVRTWYAVTNTTDQTGISTVTDVTGLSVTWTADSDRRYEVTAEFHIQKITAGANVNYYIADGSNNVKVARTQTLVTSEIRVCTIAWIETGLSGSQTRKIRADTSTNTLNIINSFTRNGIIRVRDIGPAS